MNPKPFEVLAQICAAKGVTEFVVSPGSRSAAILLGLARHQSINLRAIPDERAAAFLALGMAENLAEPVGLLCTSGSATINYGPAIAEAFYRNIPLLVLTADRPPEWLGQQDGQTLPQRGVFGSLVKASFELPVNYAHPDEEWQHNRILNEAINLANALPKGPVHINIPVREPFYPANGELNTFDHNIRLIHETQASLKLNKHTQLELVNKWLSTERKMIIAGQGPWNEDLRNAIQALRYYTSLPVIADVTANIHNVPELIRHHDLFLPNLADEETASMQPDLLVTFGQSILSKSLKAFIRKNPPKEHWHIQPAGNVADALQSITRIIRLEPSDFITTLGENGFFSQSEKDNSYSEAWQSKNEEASRYIATAFEHLQFGEFAALKSVMDALPDNSALHLANSMPVRYANYLHLNPERRIRVFANRGTSGIDGCTSTSIGCAWVHRGLVTLFTGDMAFLYDRNGLWHNYLPTNIRIVVFNNHGGGIFRMIDGPARQPEMPEFFETRQSLNTENTARDFGMRYFKVADNAQLSEAIALFLDPLQGAAIMEIETDSVQNAAFLKEFKSGFKG